MKIKEITDYLESIAPLKYQEGYDNAGLIVGHPEDEVTGITFCLDSTEAVLDEVLSQGHNMVIAHHPIIFRGLKKLNGHHYVERVIIKAIKNNIALYAIHTNLDNVLENGVNQRIAQRLGLKDCSILSPQKDILHNDKQIGAGLIGYLEEPTPPIIFLKMLKNKMDTGCVRYTDVGERQIKKVALCGGSGSFLLSAAINVGADIFITGDFKYHEFFDANNQLIIADIGHFESEQYTIDLLFEIISKKFSNFALSKTGVNTNPIKYL